MNVVLRNRNGFSVPAGFRPSFSDASVEQLVERLFGATAPTSSKQAEPKVSAPRMELAETDTAFEVQAELPGVLKENIKISVDGKRVSLEAEVTRQSERKEGEKVVHSERIVRKFARAFTLSKEVDDERAEAKLENGILTLTLPKKVEPQPKQIVVQ
ncbi:MAG: Hsp20/alpha crystallin family protein [Herminiimonas sp.]|nr:Hsp20/alpha crystallin family protein [Herminiimonas sp.]